MRFHLAVHFTGRCPRFFSANTFREIISVKQVAAHSHPIEGMQQEIFYRSELWCWQKLQLVHIAGGKTAMMCADCAQDHRTSTTALLGTRTHNIASRAIEDSGEPRALHGHFQEQLQNRDVDLVLGLEAVIC